MLDVLICEALVTIIVAALYLSDLSVKNQYDHILANTIFTIFMIAGRKSKEFTIRFILVANLTLLFVT